MRRGSQQDAVTKGVLSLWRNLVIPVGFVLALILIALLVREKITLVVMCLAFVALTHTMIRVNRQCESPYCFLIPYVSEISFFWTAVVILLLDLFGEYLRYELNGIYNPDLQVMPILFFAPMAAAVLVWIRARGLRNTFCRDCMARAGVTAEHSLLGGIYHREAGQQVKILMYVYTVLTVLEWGHYFTFFSNTNLSQLDYLIGVWIPAIVFVVLLVGFSVRYYYLWRFMSGGENRASTTIRFLVICGDKILVSGNGNGIDTIAQRSLPFCQSVSEITAIEIFRDIMKIPGGKVRFLYQSSDFMNLSNVLHYAAFVDREDDVANSGIKGVWLELPQVQELFEINAVAPALMSEVGRIYTVVMAWKTYTRDGKRRYKVKYYLPTFRLRDMPDWDVDYNDPTWLFVSAINEDRLFYRIRTLWYRYVSGVLGY